MMGLVLAGLVTPTAWAVDASSIDWSCSGGIPAIKAPVFTATLRNCAKEVPGKGRLQKRVLWLHGKVDSSAFARVGRSIRSGNYQEVWLNSGGGSVDEGLKIGKALRRQKVVLRVIRHPGVFCVSSCTIITMGGYNRIIERDAEFIVHASSYFLDGVTSGAAAQFACGNLPLEECLPKQATALRDMGDEVQRITQKGIQETFAYFQTMLDGRPRRNLMASVALPPVSVYSPDALQGRDIKEDLLLISSGAEVALQEIFTQFELRTSRLLIERARAEVERNPEPYGLGALESVKLHEAMFMCRIQDLCLLQREQLFSIGYQNFEMANEQ